MRPLLPRPAALSPCRPPGKDRRGMPRRLEGLKSYFGQEAPVLSGRGLSAVFGTGGRACGRFPKPGPLRRAPTYPALPYGPFSRPLPWETSSGAPPDADGIGGGNFRYLRLVGRHRYDTGPVYEISIDGVLGSVLEKLPAASGTVGAKGFHVTTVLQGDVAGATVRSAKGEITWLFSAQFHLQKQLSPR